MAGSIEGISRQRALGAVAAHLWIHSPPGKPGHVRKEREHERDLGNVRLGAGSAGRADGGRGVSTQALEAVPSVRSPAFRATAATGVAFGVAYGLSFRLLFGHSAKDDLFGMVSVGFLVCVPFALGFLT